MSCHEALLDVGEDHDDVEIEDSQAFLCQRGEVLEEEAENTTRLAGF
jgi:hypothetical protein